MFSWENTWIHITSETGLTRWILNSCIRLKWVKWDRDGKWEKARWWWNGSPRTLYKFYLLFGFMESSMCYGLLDFIFTFVHSTIQYFVQKKVWSFHQYSQYTVSLIRALAFDHLNFPHANGTLLCVIANNKTFLSFSDCVKLKKNLS